MPDDRMIHRRMLRGERIAALTDFERGVWLAYQLIADDYGVMRFSGVDLQRAIWLEQKPRKTIQRGFDRVADVGLVQTFQDGGRTYAYQLDWQFWQKVKHPRGTIEPCPPLDALRQCEAKTQELFRAHPRCPKEFLPQDFGKVSEILPENSSDSSETFQTLARAGGRETLTANANANGNGSDERRAHDSQRDEFSRRIRAFVDWYGETHERLIGVGYIGNPRNDYERTVELCRKFSDQDLRDAAHVWFGMDDKWATEGTRTIGKFASRASKCLEIARRVA